MRDLAFGNRLIAENTQSVRASHKRHARLALELHGEGEQQLREQRGQGQRNGVRCRAGFVCHVHFPLAGYAMEQVDIQLGSDVFEREAECSDVVRAEACRPADIDFIEKRRPDFDGPAALCGGANDPVGANAATAAPAVAQKAAREPVGPDSDGAVVCGIASSVIKLQRSRQPGRTSRASPKTGIEQPGCAQSGWHLRRSASGWTKSPRTATHRRNPTRASVFRIRRQVRA